MHIKNVCRKHRLLLGDRVESRLLEKHEMTTEKKFVLCDGPICLEDAIYRVEVEEAKK